LANFCSNCGAKLEDDEKICTDCGVPLVTDFPVHKVQPVQPQSPKPVPVVPKKKSKAPLIIGCIVAAGLFVFALFVVAIVLFIGFNKSGFFSKLNFSKSNILNNTEKTGAEPWVGLWFYREAEKAELFNMNADGTFKADIYNTEENSHEEMTGKYTISDGNLVLFDILYKGEQQEQELKVAFKIDGDKALRGERSFTRVQDKDVKSLLADLTASHSSSENEMSASDSEPEQQEIVDRYLSPKLSKKYVDAMESKKYSMKYVLITNSGGTEMKTNARITVDGKNIGTEVVMPQTDVRMKTIIKGDKMYVINDNQKTYQIMPSNQNQNGNKTDDYSNLEYLEEGTGTINGRTLPYEEYQSSDAKFRYYFDGTALYAIETILKDAKAIMIIEEFLHSVSPDLLTVPKGYKQI